MSNREFRHPTDDRDLDPRDQFDLVVELTPNGDYQIGSTRTGTKFTTGSRVCTSGGTSARYPRISKAVADLYTALRDACKETIPPEVVQLIGTAMTPGNLSKWWDTTLPGRFESPADLWVDGQQQEVRDLINAGLSGDMA